MASTEKSDNSYIVLIITHFKLKLILQNVLFLTNTKSLGFTKTIKLPE